MNPIVKRLITVTAAATLALSASVGLTGCFGNPIENLVEQGVKDAVKDATGVDVKDAGTSIPADFPSDIPLVDGKLVFGGSVTLGGSKMWTITFQVADVANTMASVKEKLLGAGFTEGMSVVDGGSAVSSFDGRDDYSVAVTAETSDGKVELTYLVTDLTS